MAPLSVDLATVLDTLQLDKKHAAGALRWVLPTDDGWAIDADVPEDLVRQVAATVLAGRQSAAGPMTRAAVTVGPS